LVLGWKNNPKPTPNKLGKCQKLPIWTEHQAPITICRGLAKLRLAKHQPSYAVTMRNAEKTNKTLTFTQKLSAN